MHEYLLFPFALIAEIAGTIAGFGSSSILTPLASQLFDFRTVLLLVAIYHIFGNISRFSLTYQHRNAQVFWLFGIPSIIATVFGASLAGIINPDLLKLILGIVLIIFASYSLYQPTWKVVVSPLLGRVGGAVSWFTAGLIGTWWVLRGAFMTLWWLKKEEYIATIASVALVVDMTRIPLYIGQGFLDVRYLWMVPILFFIAFIGSWIGKQIVARLDASVLKAIILRSIIIVSAVMTWQAGYILWW